VRKIASPQMAGVLVPHSGKRVFQTTPVVSLQNSGRFCSWLTLFPAGPRHCGQFSARAKEQRMVRMMAENRVERTIGEEVGKCCGIEVVVGLEIQHNSELEA